MKIRRWTCRDRGVTSRRLLRFLPWDDEWRCHELQMNRLEDSDGKFGFPRFICNRRR